MKRSCINLLKRYRRVYVPVTRETCSQRNTTGQTQYESEGHEEGDERASKSFPTTSADNVAKEPFESNQMREELQNLQKLGVYGDCEDQQWEIC